MAEQKNPQAQPELSLSEQTRIRREKLTNLQAEGQNPFVITRFDWDATSQQIKDNFDAMEGKPVKVAGRLMSKRGMGKVSFCDLQDRDGRIQLYARQDEMDEEVYKKFKKFDIGDIVGVEGEAFRTQRGEMSVRAHNITLLSKSLLPLPEKFHGLQDKELRFRQRYVDLMVNPEVKKNFVIRSQFIKFMRNYLDNMGYMEVETPVLNTIAGGAAARPFITHHNTLDIDMYMRIATELPLKRLIVGGMDRVYEIGRIFRNEGMDPKHNPEFTTVEMYQAYADFHTMMDIAEGILAGAAKEINGSYQVEWMGEQIDLTPGWRRLTMVDAVKEYVGVDFGAITDDAEAVAAAKAVGVELADAAEKTWGNALYACFDQKVEEKLIQPTFITMYPVEVSPLTKRSPADPRLTERFELFICHSELANAYSELNDPIDQRQRFEKQVEQRERGDDETEMLDEDFLTALEYGMPPTGGIGYGIDGYCCEVGDKLRETSDKPINYAGIAIKGLLFHYHPTSATVIVDGVEHKYKKVWLAPTMNGRYYGGGMIPTPKQDRLNKEHTVSVMVYYGSGKIKSLAVFPSIFKGEHVNHKEMVEVLSGKEITVRFDSPAALQVDGETIIGVTEYSVRTGKAAEKLNPAEAFVCA